MKAGVSVLGAALLVLGAQQVAIGQPRGGGPTIDQAQGERYDGPKARIAVADFEDKMSTSGQYRAEYGRGMADMLATALFNTNRFIVLERQKLTYVLAEQDLGASGRIKRETAAPIGEREGAELLVTAAVTGFDPGVAGAGGSTGGLLKDILGRKAGEAVGSIAGGFRRAELALDIRVIDTKTGRIVAANNVHGSATDFGGSLGVATTTFGGALGGFAKTPMEKAIREAIQTSVDFVVANTPARYYRAPATALAPAPAPALQTGPPAQAPPAMQMAAPGQMPPPQMAPPGQMMPSSGQMTPQPGQMMPPPSQIMPPQMAGSSQPQVASVPPMAATQAPKAIAIDRNPKLTAEVTEARQRGAVVSVTVTLRNPSESKQRLELKGKETYLLDYTEGKKYELIGLQGQRSLEIGPNEQVTLRATFKAPQNATNVSVVIDDIGTFDDVQLAR